MSGTVKAGGQCALLFIVPWSVVWRPGITVCIWGLDREDESPARQVTCRFSQSQPRWLWDGTGRAWAVGSGLDGGLLAATGRWWWVTLAGLQLMRGGNIKHAPLRVQCRSHYGLGQHSGWHCTHSEFSTNSLGSLTGGRQGNGSAHPHRP